MDPSPYAEQRYKDGLECAKRAVQYDQEGHYSGALSFYSEAVEALNHACSMSPAFLPIQAQVREYSRRADELSRYIKSTRQPQLRQLQGKRLETQLYSGTVDRERRYLQQMEYFVEVAMSDKERGRLKEAENLYNSAIEFALEAQKKLKDPANKSKLLAITTRAVERLEQLKQRNEPSAPDLGKILDQMPAPPSAEPHMGSSKNPVRGGLSATKKYMGPLMSYLDADPDLSKAPQFTAYSSSEATGGGAAPKPRPHATPTPVGSGRRHKGAHFTDAEVKVLRATSKINGIVYVPWSDADLAALRAISPIAQDFCDPAGLPSLAAKQKSQFHAWMRPHEMCEAPKMVYIISSFSIKQSIIGDCSFVASLAVCSDYERKFKTTLITRIIHPQNRSGEPIINPHGRYLVSFNLNGCRRKVEIDDRLPVGNYGELLCSYSSNADEFWISIIEKAYMKVMGGYDFPGSSSNIDLHALTGWIPERISMKNASDKIFKKLEVSLKKGTALITVATGPMSEEQEKRAGLVQTHAYAVLNIVEAKGIKLMQLKNPWSHRRWKGKYSEVDKTNWTPELRRLLNFDQSQALQVDNGVFWIDWKSLQEFYDVIYVNWKPEMFRHKSTIHDVWVPGHTQKDLYDLSSNPQYSLKIHSPVHTPLVWILLTRHIITKSDFANNEKFIALNITPSDGNRVYLPENFVVQGVKINTPHYLAKLEELIPGDSTFTVIVSQLDSFSTIHYTLRVYSTCEFSVAPVHDPYHHTEELTGSWQPGSRGSAHFKLTTPTFDSKLLIKLKCPKELFVQIGIGSSSSATDFHPLDTGVYRPGVTFMEVPSLPKGEFKISARFMTAKTVPSKAVTFIITVQSSQVFSFEHG